MPTITDQAQRHQERTAILSDGTEFTYRTLLDVSAQVASCLLKDRKDLEEDRIAYMTTPSFDYVAVMWGIWRAGGIAVPLCIKHPLPALEYTLRDSQANVLVAGPEYYEMLQPLADSLGISLLRTEDAKTYGDRVPLPSIPDSRRALILYTSGTTSQPKGVVSTHANLVAQINALVTFWEWSEDDHILNILPLHHTHGILNIVCCALWSGATCEFLPTFSPDAVWKIFMKGDLSLFMAVPTIYHKLIAHWEEADEADRAAMSESGRHFRLMVSGSAALPVSTLEKWRQVTGHTLLERYGMTEIGMGLSNPYRGERRPGHVGVPLPGVEVKLVDESGQTVEPGGQGEILVKGPNVFLEYWNKLDATRESFDEGWFKTGDIAVLDEGSYKILGRNSIDIIKSGAYKISALEIEEALRAHPRIQECAVIGVPDEEWGEMIVGCLVAKEDISDFDGLKDWLKERLPPYKVPRRFVVLDDLPRNAMGKVTKKDLVPLFIGQTVG